MVNNSSVKDKLMAAEVNIISLY